MQGNRQKRGPLVLDQITYIINQFHCLNDQIIRLFAGQAKSTFHPKMGKKAEWRSTRHTNKAISSYQLDSQLASKLLLLSAKYAVTYPYLKLVGTSPTSHPKLTTITRKKQKVIAATDNELNYLLCSLEILLHYTSYRQKTDGQTDIQTGIHTRRSLLDIHKQSSLHYQLQLTTNNKKRFYFSHFSDYTRGKKSYFT